MRHTILQVTQPSQPEPTPFKKFDNALRKVLTVPKSEVDKKIKAQKRARRRKRKKG